MKKEYLMLGAMTACAAALAVDHGGPDFDLLDDDIAAPTPKAKKRPLTTRPLDSPPREVKKKSASLRRMLNNKRRK